MSNVLPRSRSFIPRARTTVLVLGLAVSFGLAGSAAPALGALRTPQLDPNETVVDGPSADIQSLNGMAVARDGTGGLVYVKQVGGVNHVFVSRLLNGSFQAPQQVDAGLSDGSAQPVIAAAGGGVLLVAFVNDGTLYTAQALSASTPISAPTALAGSAANPSLAISPSGKGYLAYTATGGAHSTIGFAFYAAGSWQVGTGSLDATTTANAGNGTDRPSVAACGEGIGVVAWGENNHVYVRRLVGATPSVEIQQADPATIGGAGEIGATDPQTSCVGYSTYIPVVYDETVETAGGPQTQVMFNRFNAELLEGGQPLDGVPVDGPESAGQPAVAVTESGTGLVTSSTSVGHELDVSALSRYVVPTPVTRLDSILNQAPPDAAPSVAGLVSTFVAWQQTPGVAGPAEIRLRTADDGSSFGPEQVLSNPALGPTDADAGLVDGGDLSGDEAVAWVQSPPQGGNEIVAAQLFQSPNDFVPSLGFRYVRTRRPQMSWTPPKELWGGCTFTLTIDGVPTAATASTVAGATNPLSEGRHVWTVTARNLAGQSTTARRAVVFVDTLKPTGRMSISGRRVARATLHVGVRVRDRVQAGLKKSTASGIKKIVLHWGDGAVRRAHGSVKATHRYRRGRRYRITLDVYDRAGNRTVITRRVRIAAAPAPSTTKRPSKTKRPSTTKRPSHTHPGPRPAPHRGTRR